MSSAIASLIAVLALWVCLAFFCCSGSAYKTSKVTYRVDGTGRASLTYSNATGGTEQREVTLPWTQTFDGSPGEFLYLSAQNEEEYGGVVASISINGRVVKDATSSGGFTIATVSDTCCRWFWLSGSFYMSRPNKPRKPTISGANFNTSLYKGCLWNVADFVAATEQSGYWPSPVDYTPKSSVVLSEYRSKWSAKPLFIGSIPIAASNQLNKFDTDCLKRRLQ